jgi:hypothetical protein
LDYDLTTIPDTYDRGHDHGAAEGSVPMVEPIDFMVFQKAQG